jgi:CRP-like cAMP-binding protein
VSKPNNQVFLDLCLGAPVERFLIGEYLMRQGDDANFAYFLNIGQVDIQISDPTGEAVHVASRFAGELVGELSLFNRKRSASVIAEVDCECVRVPHAALLHGVATNPAIAIALLAMTMDKAKEYRWAN